MHKPKCTCVCAMWLPLTPPLLDPRVLQLLRAGRQSSSQCQHWAAMARPRFLLGDGRCVSPFTPPELHKTSVSMRSNTESSALVQYSAFSSK